MIFSICTLGLSCAGLNTASSAQYEFKKGLGYFNNGKYQQAETHFTRATLIDPEYTQAYLYLGKSYINTYEWMDALNPIWTAYRISPDDTKSEISVILLKSQNSPDSLIHVPSLFLSTSSHGEDLENSIASSVK